jgi:hypothetical protein
MVPYETELKSCPWLYMAIIGDNTPEKGNKTCSYWNSTTL